MNIAVAIVGPTASGKSALALDLSGILGAEIVCLDSTTVYREFNIGSNKPSPSFQHRIPHHLLDILSPGENFSAHHFVERADKVLEDIHARGKLPMVVGGAHFYLRALQNGMVPVPPIPVEIPSEIEKEFFEEEALNTRKMHEELKARDPDTADKIHPNDTYRLVRALCILRVSGELPSQLQPGLISRYQSNRLWMKYAIMISRHELNQRIVDRTEHMLREGLVEETKNLMEKYPGARALKSIGYLECTLYLQEKLNLKQLRAEIIEKTRRLAKRQICWLRSDPQIRFVDARDIDRMVLEIHNLQFALGENPCTP